MEVNKQLFDPYTQRETLIRLIARKEMIFDIRPKARIYNINYLRRVNLYLKNKTTELLQNNIEL